MLFSICTLQLCSPFQITSHDVRFSLKTDLTARYYDPVRLALAAGIQPPMPYPVTCLMRELNQLMADDRLADILPADSFHFTFLPLTLPLFEEHEELPAKTAQLTELWREYQAKHIVIR